MDLPRVFTIRESSHRIHNPFSAEKLAILGRALHLAPGSRVLDLACGSGELRAELRTEPVRHARYQREYLG